MPLAPAITDIEQLKDRPFVADLLAWRADAVESARYAGALGTVMVRTTSV